MVKVLIGGIAVGLANIIPGVSGGTMMVILGLFDRVMESITGLFTKDLKQMKKHLIFLLVLGFGALIGLVVFANVLELLFVSFPTQTLFCFVGMVAFSIPSLKKKQMKDDKFKIIPFLIGCALIVALCLFAPEQTDTVITEFQSISLIYLAMMFGLGIIAGGAMFVPGISGSMILLIIGQYYLFKSLVANVTTFELNVIIPLGVMAVGIVVGIALSSKLTNYCLNKNHAATMNFILGLVVASSVMLIPFTASYDVFTILTSVVGIIIGGAIVFGLEKLA